MRSRHWATAVVVSGVVALCGFSMGCHDEHKRHTRDVKDEPHRDAKIDREGDRGHRAPEAVKKDDKHPKGKDDKKDHHD